MIFDSLLRKLFDYRDIPGPNGEGLYLRRFFITPRRWAPAGAWPRALFFVPRKLRKIFVHHILLSDDRVPHDHPWDFTTVILAGEYRERVYPRELMSPHWEYFPAPRSARRGTVLRNKATHIHWLEIVRPVWSLVFVGDAHREWGFWNRGRFVPWRKHLGLPDAPTELEDQ